MNRQTTFQNCGAEDVDTVVWIRNHTASLHKKINQFLRFSPYPAEEFIQLAHETALNVKPRAAEKGISFDRYFWRAYHKVCCLMAPLPSMQKLVPFYEEGTRSLDCLFCGKPLDSAIKTKGITEGPLVCTSCHTAIPKEYYDGGKTPCKVEEYRDGWESDGDTAAAPTLGASLTNGYFLNSIEDRFDAHIYRMSELKVEDFAQNQALKCLNQHQQDILGALISTKGSAAQVAERFNVVKQTIQKTRERAYSRIERESETLRPTLSRIPRP